MQTSENKSPKSNVLAVVCARGNSKGLPGKNLRVLNGKPLIAWSIEAALKASCVERTIVSTDSPSILQMAVSFGAEGPFLRPSELAQDETPGIDPVLHAMKWLKANEGYVAEHVLLLQPTSPMRTTEDIEAAVQIAARPDVDSVIGVTPVSKHPYWMKTIGSGGLLESFIVPNTASKYLRRQDLPQIYQVNGSIYLTRYEVLEKERTFQPARTAPYLMPEHRSVDIDTEMDFEIASMMMKLNKDVKWHDKK